MPQQQYQHQIGHKAVTVTSKTDKTEETKYWNNLLERPREKAK